MIRRRSFITLLGGAAVLAACRAGAAASDAGDRLRPGVAGCVHSSACGLWWRIGVLTGPDENDPEGKLCYSAFNGDSQR